MRRCPKCNAVSGDDWSQCEGSCPMEMSPHYDANLVVEAPAKSVRYVCTILRDSNTQDRGIFVLKKHGPPAVVSRWNGVGGRVEENESWYDAHRRETIEEVGLELMEPDSPLAEALVSFPEATIHFAMYDIDMCPTHFELRDYNDVGEPLSIRNFEAANHVENLYWIVPLLSDLALQNPKMTVRAF